MIKKLLRRLILWALEEEKKLELQVCSPKANPIVKSETKIVPAHRRYGNFEL